MTVKKVETAYDYLALVFDDEGDTGINIYNRYTISEGSPYDLTGKTIEDVAKTSEDLKITFSDGTCLLIGMRESDYNGPESLIYFAGDNFYVDQ
jgi:hypothetical protein